MRHGWAWWPYILMLIGSGQRVTGQDNNTAPMFTERVYELPFPENTLASTFVWEANVTDPDSGPSGQITFKLDSSIYFNITRSGKLLYLGGLDYEVPELRESVLRVTATDGGTPPKSAEALINVHLSNIDDFRPKFPENLYNTKVVNGSPAGTFLIQMWAEDKDTPVIYYSLAVPNQYFQIDNVTGNITASQTVNRRLIEDDQKQSFFVIAEDGSVQNALVQVRITIVDPNLHSPQFTENPYDASVYEHETAHVTVINVSASDRDPHTPTIRYDIVPDEHSDKFIIDADIGVITLNGSFDREAMLEENDTIILLVTATDDGFPPATSTTTVRVRIQDIDDNSPRFVKDTHEIYLFQDFTMGLSFDLPTATDRDIGSNGLVKYNMSREGETIFEIDETTGRITTRMDCETDCVKLSNSTYMEFILRAINAKDESIPGDAMLIKVVISKRPPATPGTTTLDASTLPIGPLLSSTGSGQRVTGQDNNTAPMFTERVYELPFLENTLASTFVWEANVTDPDSGPSGQITFKLDSSIYFIITRSGKLLYLGGLDYEVPELRESVLRVTATDGGTPPKSAEALINVHLSNINDFRPTFPEILYYTKVVNGSPAGTFLIQMWAEDKDTPVIYYSLAVPNQYFQIDNVTGNITASQTVNRRLIEDDQKQSFFVIAEDGSVQKALVRVRITIVDPNLHSPQFTENPYDATVSEHETAHVTVINVSASDRDSHTPTIRYDIVPDEHSDKFIIDADIGVITLNGSFDREAMLEENPRQYKFIIDADIGVITLNGSFDREAMLEENGTIILLVTATDNGFPPATSTTTVRVRIRDIDDNGPRFVKDTHEIYLFQDFTTGLSFDLPTATDRDIGSNGLVKYNMSKEGETIFEIDETTGRITTRMDCETDCVKLSNSTYMEFILRAINAKDESIPGDAMLIKVVISKRPPTTPGTTTLDASTLPKEPLLSSTEITVIIVVALLVVLIIFIIFIILVYRRRNKEKEKVKITPPQNPRPIQLEDEVCY